MVRLGMPRVNSLAASPEIRHLPSLDGVRGLAVLIVMVSHLYVGSPDSGGSASRFLLALISYGKFGVDLFFVLSGFLITGILIDTRDDPGFFRKFYARRTLRIFPLYYGTLLLFLLLTPFLHLHWQGMGVPLFTYTENLWPMRYRDFALSPQVSLFHFWSLAIEEQFYLVWPLIVFFVGRKRWGVLIAALSGCAVALLLRCVLASQDSSVRTYLVTHTGTLTRMDTLLIGAILAVLYRRPVWSLVVTISPWIFVALSSLLIVTIVWHGDDSPSSANFFWKQGPRYDVLAFAFASLMVWAMTPESPVQRLFSGRTLRFLGKYSYGLYILHVFVRDWVSHPVRHLVDKSTGNKALGVAVSGTACMALAVVLAYLSYNLFEKRFLRLKRRFSYSEVRPIVRA